MLLQNLFSEEFHTNLYGNESTHWSYEEQYYFWFDPTKDCHKCNILWTPNNISNSFSLKFLIIVSLILNLIIIGINCVCVNGWCYFVLRMFWYVLLIYLLDFTWCLWSCVWDTTTTCELANWHIVFITKELF